MAGTREDVVQVIQNRVDAGELVEGADGERKKNGQKIAALKEVMLRGAALLLEGELNCIYLGPRIGRAHAREDQHGFVDAVLAHQPAGAMRHGEQHDEEEDRRQYSDAELPAPHGDRVHEMTDDRVGKIGKQDADDDVDLKQPNEPSAPFGRRKLGDVYRAQDGGTADSEAADEARDHEECPAGSEGTPDGRQNIKNTHQAQRRSAADALSQGAAGHGADHRAPKRDGYG